MRRGHYNYIKHAFYHTMDNRSRYKRNRVSHRVTLIENTSYYLKYTKDDINQKVKYLTDLVHNNKYQLYNSDIRQMLIGLKDNELFRAYFDEDIKDYQKRTSKWMLIVLVITFGFIIISCLK